MTALLLAACVAAAAPLVPGVQADKDWKRLRSEHFVAVGDADYIPMRNILVELEGFRRALLRSSPTLRVVSAVPTTVVVFKDEGAFARFKPLDDEGRPRETVAAYLLSSLDANYLVVAAHRDAGRTFHYLFHEYTHFIVRENNGEVPEWLNEGLAEFYSTFQVNPRERRAVVGEPPRNRLPLLAGAPRLPLLELLTMDREDRSGADSRRQQMFYAQSWALVHFLTLGDGGRHRPGIARYLAEVRKGQPVDAAVLGAFGMPLAELEDAVARYGQRSTFPRQVIDEPQGGVAVRTSLEALTPDQAAAFQRELLRVLKSEGGAAGDGVY